MPYLRIETNVPQKDIPENFLKEISKILATTLGKPQAYCSVAIFGGVNLIFGGSDEPCAQASLMSIGQLGVKENKLHAKVLSEKIHKDLGIDPNRMYITFHNVPSSDVGYGGTTFHDILG